MVHDDPTCNLAAPMKREVPADGHKVPCMLSYLCHPIGIRQCTASASPPLVSQYFSVARLHQLRMLDIVLGKLINGYI